MHYLLKQLLSFFDHRRNIGFILWVVFFCYSVCAALIFQHIVLPHLSSIQSGSGLISNDADYFDSVASVLAQQINENGWSSWRLYPANGAPGNVAILGGLYALFGHDPSLAIPINAGLHALGGMLIFLVARELATNNSNGIFAGAIAGTLFVAFPSSLVWYGQNHKDSYAIAGMLLMLFVWIKAFKKPSNLTDWLFISLLGLCATFLVGSVRPFLLKLLLIVGIIVFITLVLLRIFKKITHKENRLIIFTIAMMFLIFAGIQATRVLGGLQSDTVYDSWQDSSQGNLLGWRWNNSAFVPDVIENYIESAARTRAGLISYGLSVKAGSMIDQEITPQDVVEVLAYAPRAFQVSLLAPFPSTWFESRSITKVASSIEMLLYYLCLPGVLLLLYYNRKPATIFSVCFAGFFLLVYGFTQANLGTIYRYRYAYTFIVTMLGALGWITWLDQSGHLKRWLSNLDSPAKSPLTEKQIDSAPHSARKKVLGSGLIVTGLTFLTFVGFFLRDIFMAQTYGLGPMLDGFFIALLIPMFIVTVICMPLGAALIPIYLEIKEKTNIDSAGRFISGVSFWTTFILLIASVALHFLAPAILPHLFIKNSIQDIPQLIQLWDLALLLLLFSGILIIGNAVLNAHEQSISVGLAQLVVPLLAVLGLGIGAKFGAYAVMVGMVTGQILNLIIIQWRLKRINISLIPNFDKKNSKEQSELLSQYLPLMISAFFVAVAAPVATFLAISLPEGGVSAYNLGNKVILFVTGLLGVAVSTVILPYFSSLIARNHLVSARRELSFFLLTATYISIPVSVCMYIWAEPTIRIMFERGTFDKSSTELVTHVMQYALVQLPFFISNALLLKFATATKHVTAIALTALSGLVINVVASVFLMQHMGVPGIALGASISVICATVLLVFILVKYQHISRFDGLILLLNWLLFITLLVCLHFQSKASIYLIIITFIVLLTIYFGTQKETDAPSYKAK